MVTRQSVCLRRLSGGRRSSEVRFHRLLGNEKVTVARLIEGWSSETGPAVAGRHVLAIQDTSEITISTRPGRRRGLGEIGKGTGHGLLVHAMLALDADTGASLGLVGGAIWTRQGRQSVVHDKRPLSERESKRWIETGEQAGRVLAAAASVTVMGDRESDLFAFWATLPRPGFHLIGRVMHDRGLADGSSLYGAGERLAAVATRTLDLSARSPQRPARSATLTLRFGPVVLRRPRGSHHRHLPESVPLTLVEVVEHGPPAGVAPLHWRLLTTHPVDDAAAAWRIVDWYRRRWTIEQLFRLMKTQGLRLEDSQIETADRLQKLAAVATKAAAVTLALLQARDGTGAEPAGTAFTPHELDVLDALDAAYRGRTALQRNPHPPRSLPWAAWIIARLGGWDGYPSSRPPGPITFRHGLEHLKIHAAAAATGNLCMP
ncbi:transposase [Rhodoplanes serenus]|nr:transposase [Rhodoplanes serenus]